MRTIYCITIFLFSLSSYAQVQVCIKAERNNDPVCIPKDRESFDEWYSRNANRGHFGTNERTIDFQEGEEPRAGFESCRTVQDIEFNAEFQRCTYPPRWHIVDRQGRQVDPRNFDADNPDHLQDISAEVAASEAQANQRRDKIRNLKDRPTLTNDDLREAVKILLERL